MEGFSRTHDGYEISTDRGRFDLDVFHRYLSEESYWAAGRQRSTTDDAVANSLLFGLYVSHGAMVGAARVVTDCATFAWVCDVFVLEDHRGLGLGRALVAATLDHPCLANTKRILLATEDAHGLYAAHGFEPLSEPERWMLLRGPTI